jgi:hypothetical protein
MIMIFVGAIAAERFTRRVRTPVPEISSRARVASLVRVLQFVEKLCGRPGGDTSEVPLVQEGPGLVDCQIEALDEDARGVKGLIVAALARDGGRDLGEVSGRSSRPVVMAARVCRGGRPCSKRARSTSRSIACRRFGRRVGTSARSGWRLVNRLRCGGSIRGSCGRARSPLAREFLSTQPAGQVQLGQTGSGRTADRRSWAVRLMVPGRTIHSSGEPPVPPIPLTCLSRFRSRQTHPSAFPPR